MTDWLTGGIALLGAVAQWFGSNDGGTALSLTICAVLAWRLRQCEAKHEAVSATNTNLRVAIASLGGAVNDLAGKRVVVVASDQDILAGKPAVIYEPEPPPDTAERREPRRGRR